MARRKSPSAKPKLADKKHPLNLGELPTIIDPNLKSIWIDRMQLFVRGDLPFATLSFSTLIPPDKLIEAVRIQTTIPHMKAMAELICRNLDYYPIKDDRAS